MSILKRTIKSISIPRRFTPLVLLFLCAGSVVFLLPSLGFYWDDWAIAWISAHFGTPGLERYFSTNRVYWGKIFQLSSLLVGDIPWRWHLYALLWHWLASFSLFWTLQRLFGRESDAPVWVSCLFAVYPAYSMQSLAIFSAHFYIVLAAYFLSVGLMLVAAEPRRPAQRLLLTLLALLLSLVNQITTEYFFMLELLRPVLLWLFFVRNAPQETWRKRARRALQHWLPYLLLFLGVVYWRIFIFSARPENFQSANYEIVFFSRLKEQPLQALGALLERIFKDLALVLAGAWQPVFNLPDTAVFGLRTTLIYIALVLGSALLVYLLAAHSLQEARQNESARAAWGWSAALAGAAAVLLAGWPFWLTDLPVGLGFPNSRFTLPFILGASLLLAGLLRLLPLKPTLRIVLLSLLVGLAAGQGFRAANDYRRDWNRQKALFWQMAWRMPQLEAGTTLLANDWPDRFYSDNSLTAPLNWIYAPDNDTEHMSYMFFFPSVREGYGLPSFEPAQNIEQNYLAARFSGSTSNMLAVYFNADACLRVLDPQIDSLHWAVSPVMRQAAVASNVDVISDLPQGEQMVFPREVLGQEMPHGWCYYFEKADLARQLGDWQRVVELGDEAFALSEHPNDPAERLVFIEGYAHQGQWMRSLELTQQANEITPLMQPMLCSLWQRIAQETRNTVQKDQALLQVEELLDCNLPR